MLKTYEKKITLIEDEITEVFTRLIKASKIALTGIQDKDISRFSEARESISNIRETCDAVDNNIITTLALFSPEAKDLRKLVSYLKITAGLNKTASNIKSYNKNITKNFEDTAQYFTNINAIQTLQLSAIKVLECTLEIVHEEDKTALHDLYEQIHAEVERTESTYDIVEKELLSIEKITVEAFAQNSNILKTFRKLEKTTSRVMDIATALLYAKLDQVPHHE